MKWAGADDSWRGRLRAWIAENVVFVSWHRHWKGIYVHCISRNYCHRFFFWGHDKHRKAWLPNIPIHVKTHSKETLT